MYVLSCDDTLDIPLGVAMILITTESFDLLLRDILHACYDRMDISLLFIYLLEIKII